MAYLPTEYNAPLEKMLGNSFVSKMIAEAKAEAIKVGRREHIKADRHERVRLFCNLLRTKLTGQFNPQVVSKSGLLKHRMWLDAGQLASDHDIRMSACGSFLSLIKECVMKAETFLVQEDETQSIATELAELDLRIKAARAMLEPVPRLTKEVDALDKKFQELEKELNEHIT